MSEFNMEEFKKLPREDQWKFIEPHLDQIRQLVLERSALAPILSTIFAAILAIGSLNDILPYTASRITVLVSVLCIPVPLVIANIEYRVALQRHQEIAEKYIGQKITVSSHRLIEIIASYYIDFFIYLLGSISLVIAYYVAKCLF